MANLASRSALEYLQRKGIIVCELPPRPRLCLADLLVNSVPVPAEQTSRVFLQDADGSPPPDRGAAQPWPNQR